MVKLYTTGCPKCSVLKNKLISQGIPYETITDKDLMISRGFNFIPLLEVDGKIMDFGTAVKWVSNQGEKNEITIKDE